MISDEKREYWEKELYKLWLELRKDGIIWTDPKIENIGILKKANKVYRNSTIKNSSIVEDTDYVADEAVGFTGKREKKILDAGEVVVIDLDHIYEVSQIVDWGLLRARAKFFEQCYRNELNLEREDEER